jgi:outer membrane protein assembly factor BamB
MSMDLPLRRGFEQFRLIRPVVSDGAALFVLQTDGSVAAVDANGGARWRRDAVAPRPPLTAQVALGVLANQVVVKEGETFFALARHDGTEQWRTQFRGDPQRSHFDGARLWGFHAHTSSVRDPGDIVTLELAGGAARPIVRRPRHCQVLATTDDRIIIYERNGSGAEQLVAIDPAGGAERWSSALDRPSSTRPGQRAVPSPLSALRHGRLLIMPLVEYGFVAFDVERGSVVWELDLHGGGTTPLLVGDRLHVNASWRFVELDAASGVVISDVDITDPAQRRATAVSGQMAHRDGVLYAASIDGVVFGWSLAERALIWTHALSARVELACPPRIFLDTLWIMDGKGGLHPFALP